MNLFDAFYPSIILAEMLFPYRDKSGVIADSVERIAEGGFYRCIEIGFISNGDERRRIKNITAANSLSVTQWMTSVLTGEKLNLSSIDSVLRAKSVARLKELMYNAAECGVVNLAVVSGPDPGKEFRKDATESFFDSMCELSEALSIYKGMNLIFEPLDREAHKNMLIGPTSEAIDIVKRLRKISPDIGISWDSAHVALCGEEIEDSLAQANEYIFLIHLSNAILDKYDAGFGDHHMFIGSPGFLTMELISKLFKRAIDMELFYKKIPSVAVEVRTLEGNDPWETEKHCREILLKSWQLLEKY